MASFEPAVEITLAHEGGFFHDLQSGEVVNHGITLELVRELGILKTTGPVLQSDIAFMKSLDLEEAKHIYLTVFWEPNSFDQFDSQDVAAKTFDLQVNTDHGVKFLQEAVNVLQDGPAAEELVIDGVVGPKTIAATNACNPMDLLGITSEKAADGIAYGIRRFAEQYYRGIVIHNPAKAKDLPGWLARLDS